MSIRGNGLKQRVYLTFSKETVREPLIWKAGREFDVMTNIRTAEVREDMGLVGLEIEGAQDVVEQALAWFTAQGVHVEPIEQNVIEG
ncbi:MAG: NIL domain-containing protein [Mariprofundaceae bacterium]|nr:NIL domain-containing protein [Mariprofundaceae bacterium]